MVNECIQRTCCFFGNRIINDTKELRAALTKTLEGLITEESVDTFLFGSKSEFNSLCLELVTKTKEKHPNIKRIYARAEYPIIDDDYKAYLLKFYEDTYYPKIIAGAGKAAYVKRNYEMINNSRFCVVYYHQANVPNYRKSGTKIALDYAVKKGKTIILL